MGDDDTRSETGKRTDCPVCAPAKSCEPVSTATTCSIDTCRDVFVAVGQGGAGPMTDESLAKIFLDRQPLLHDVRQHLIDFTGMKASEVDARVKGAGRFHFEAEFSYWNPQTSGEMRWFYRQSVTYLFALSHRIIVPFRGKHALTPADGPVLDFSGGAGNNCLSLASRGIKCIYTGVGVLEMAFFEYRVKRLGLEDMVTTLHPHSEKTAWRFDFIDFLPQDESVGTILAIDVLEHIPQFEKVVAAMVASIRPGGRIIEHSPFDKTDVKDGNEDLRIHVSRRGVKMPKALGPTMFFEKRQGPSFWKKKGGESK